MTLHYSREFCSYLYFISKDEVDVEQFQKITKILGRKFSGPGIEKINSDMKQIELHMNQLSMNVTSKMDDRVVKKEI